MSKKKVQENKEKNLKIEKRKYMEEKKQQQNKFSHINIALYNLFVFCVFEFVHC